MKAVQKAKKAINKVSKPAKKITKVGSKAAIGTGKIVSGLGYKGTGRKISQHGRAGLAASKVKDLKSARKAIDMALKANK